jgi:hypothetical protein
MKNILSIDFDFFVREDPMWDFGHSETNGMFMQLAWSARYMGLDLYSDCDMKKYADFMPDCLIGNLLRLGFHFKKNLKLAMAESHVKAYDFIKEEFGEECNVYNFDAHHDMFGGHEELNCGNWLLKLRAENLVKKIVWVKPKWLREFMDGSVHLPRTKEVYYDELIKKNLNVKFDGIFFCRSGVWTPPHLDGEFAKMVRVFLKIIPAKALSYGQVMMRSYPSPEEAKEMYERNKAAHEEILKKIKSKESANGLVNSET